MQSADDRRAEMAKGLARVNEHIAERAARPAFAAERPDDLNTTLANIRRAPAPAPPAAAKPRGRPRLIAVDGVTV